MRKGQVTLVMIVLGIIFTEKALATDPTNKAPVYKSIKDVKDELQFINNIWNGNGIVILGQVDFPKNTRISSRIPIYKDGSYCTALYQGRKLIFYSHGYDPLEVTRYSQIATNVYDAGIQQFIRTNPKNTRTLKGTAIIKGTIKKSKKIECTLQIRNHAYLWQDHGNTCGAPITISVDSAKLDSGNPFVFKNLSRIPYVLVLTAPGYIKKEIKIDQELLDVIDLGEITLVPASVYSIKYRARVRQNGGEWIGDDNAKTSTISCNGNSKFLFTKQRDGLGNTLKLRMKPSGKGVIASFFYYQRNSFYDLGQLAISELPSWNAVDTSNLNGSSDALLQDGHAYYFNIDDINGTSIQMLFQVEKN